MTQSALLAIGSVDGRYGDRTEPLKHIFSEYGLMQARINIMVRYAAAIIDRLVGPLDFAKRQIILSIADTFSPVEGEEVKVFEKTTNHDVKACELFLRQRFKQAGLGEYVEFVHFGTTSEDVNNLAYALMLQEGLNVLLIELAAIHQMLHGYAHAYASLPMLARTHGQEATPTTLGKEFSVFAHRLENLLESLDCYRVSVKLNSASGNFNALRFAAPEVDWYAWSAGFIGELCTDDSLNRPSLTVNTHTTQIEPHDTYAELFYLLAQANTVLLDFSQDAWRYISDHWLGQATVEGETGSSIMPHKVNPIDFENAEGNLGKANALFELFARKLPISRLQRDLSDSTVERDFGTAFAWSFIAYRALRKGLGKITANEPLIREALRAHPEILAEAYQTLLRRIRYPDPYGALKDFTRGRTDLTLADMHQFVRELPDDRVPADIKERMLALTPETYLGLAPDLARL
jgi:adenylosuccinate lyase